MVLHVDFSCVVMQAALWMPVVATLIHASDGAAEGSAVAGLGGPRGGQFPPSTPWSNLYVWADRLFERYS